MKFVLALFLGLVSADAQQQLDLTDDCVTAPVDFDYGVDDHQINNGRPSHYAEKHHSTGVASSNLGAYAERYLKNSLRKDQRQGLHDINNFQVDDEFTHNSHHKIIDADADRVNASYESCHVGETIIPAIKEQTNIQQAASFASDSKAQYLMKGVANNDYKLNGQMTQTNAKFYKGADKTSDCLSLSGNYNKKYCQSGNKDLGQDCNYNALKDHLLDNKAAEVCADPAAKVQGQVDKVVRSAISKAISQAVQFALDESLANTITV